MLPLLAPVLAQLITLGVHDRTEARYIASGDDQAETGEIATDGERYEASTGPGVRLTFAWPRYDVSLGYGASFLLTPLEEKPRELLVYQYVSFSTSYRFRRTVLSLSSDASFGKVNFQTQPLQTATPLAPATMGNETPAGGEPTTPAQPNQPTAPTQPGLGQAPAPGAEQPLQPNIEDRTVRYGSLSNTASVTHEASRDVTLSAFASYTMGGSLNEADRVAYPITRGWAAGVLASHSLALTARDSFGTSVNVQQAWSSNGNRATSAVGNGTYHHAFHKRLSSYFGAGVSVTRFSQDNGLVAISIFPNLTGGMNYQRLLGRGTLSLSLGAYSAPSLDPLRATVDPRIGAVASVGWTRGRFSTSLTGGSALSMADEDANAGAFDSYQASYVASYQVVDWLGIDAGASLAQQQYQAVTTVPFSYAAFVALTLGYEIPLWRGRRK